MRPPAGAGKCIRTIFLRSEKHSIRSALCYTLFTERRWRALKIRSQAMHRLVVPFSDIRLSAPFGKSARHLGTARQHCLCGLLQSPEGFGEFCKPAEPTEPTEPKSSRFSVDFSAVNFQETSLLAPGFRSVPRPILVSRPTRPPFWRVDLIPPLD